MKKTILSFGLAIILAVGMGTSSANAQMISGGIKAEANLSNFLLSDLDYMNSDLGFGATLGGFMKVNFHQNFALQPELLFHFKTSTDKISMLGVDVENDYQYWGAEIPVYAVGQMRLGNGLGYIGIGPYVGVGFSAKYDNTDFDLYEKDDIIDKAARQRWDFGFGAMLGYEFNFGLQINASYKIGIIDALDAGKDDATMLPQTISLGLAYRF